MLSDKPQRLIYDNDPFGYLSTAERLFGLLVDWFNESRKSEKSKEPLIIGLFGGYGQGKSTILETITPWLDNKDTAPSLKKKLVKPVKVLKVESWHYQLADINNHFYKVLIRENWIQNSSKLRRMVYAPIVDLAPKIDTILTSKLTQTSSERVLEGLDIFATLQDKLDDASTQTKSLLFTNIKKIYDDLIHHLKEKKLLFWIDDLDRASKEVQLAILKQVHAFRDQVGVPVVVAIDPSEILYKDDKGDNYDLLMKVFTVTLNLPGKSSEDFINYAKGLCMEAFPQIPEETAGYIADMISSATSGNPRFIKRFLNRLATFSTDYDKTTDFDKLPGLARWILAQEKWPLFFNYHGEEELIMTLIHRLVNEEPVQESLDNLLKSLGRNRPFIESDKDNVIHFLRQTRRFSTSNELDIISFLSKQSKQDFKWTDFWYFAERGDHINAISIVKNADDRIPEDFVEQFQARISRWINNRCFSEAYELLQVYWKLIYGGGVSNIRESGENTELPNLYVIVKDMKDKFFSLWLQALSHPEVLRLWNRYSFPLDFELFDRQKDIRPNNWLLLYCESQDILSIDEKQLTFILKQIRDNRDFRLSIIKINEPKFMNLFTRWLIDNYKSYSAIIDNFWIDYIPSPEFEYKIIELLLNNTMRILERLDRDECQILNQFLDKSFFYISLIGLIYKEGRASADIDHLNFWLSSLSSSLECQNIQSKDKNVMLSCLTAILGNYLEYLIKTNSCYIEDIRTNSILAKIEWKKFITFLGSNNELNPDDTIENHTSGKILILGLYILSQHAVAREESLLEDQLIKSFFSAIEGIFEFDSHIEHTKIVTNLLRFLIPNIITPYEVEQYSPDPIKNTFIQNIFASIGRLQIKTIAHPFIGDIWLSISKIIEHLEPNYKNSLIALLSNSEVFKVYLLYYKDISINELFLPYCHRNKDWYDSLIDNTITDNTKDLRRYIPTLVTMLTSGGKNGMDIQLLDIVQRRILQQWSDKSYIYFRKELLKQDYQLWVKCPTIIEKPLKELFHKVESFLLNVNDSKIIQELSDSIIEEAQNDENKIYDALVSVKYSMINLIRLQNYDEHDNLMQGITDLIEGMKGRISGDIIDSINEYLLKR